MHEAPREWCAAIYAYRTPRVDGLKPSELAECVRALPAFRNLGTDVHAGVRVRASADSVEPIERPTADVADGNDE
jgi:hypothetical protein